MVQKILSFVVCVLCSVSLANAQGLSGDVCEAGSSTCQGNRKCYEVSMPTLLPVECTADSELCVCLDTDATCESSNDCDEGERCARELESGQNFQVCISCNLPSEIFESLQLEFVDENPSTCPSATVSPTPSSSAGVASDAFPTSEHSPDANPAPSASPETGLGGDENEDNNDGADEEEDNDEVCISIEALSGYSQKQLVYSDHRRAAVLCDQYGNCATPGHMVLYKQRPMMMRTYCAQTQQTCTRRVMLVNSPRMKTAMRIPSKSEHLQFLAFAARMQTRTEEVLLSGLIRLGL